MPVADVLAAVNDMAARHETLAMYRDYREGRHRWPFASDGFKRRYSWLLRSATANKCGMVVSGFADYAKVSAWAGTNADLAQEVDNLLDVSATIGLTVDEAFTTGDGWILVWPDAQGINRPWFHRAAGISAAPDPSAPGRHLWVAKSWIETDPASDARQRGRVTIYYPDRLERWETDKPLIDANGASLRTWDAEDVGWREYHGDGEAAVQSHDMGRVPWVHISRDPVEQGGYGRSILADVIPLQDGLNHVMASIMAGVERYGAPIMALLKHEATPVYNEHTGQVERPQIDIDPTKQAVITVAGEGPMQQFTPPDSQNLIRVAEWITSEIANTVGLPVSEIAPDLGNIPSNAALRTLASRRTRAVEAFTAHNTKPVADLMDMLGVPDCSPEWVDPAPMDISEKVTVAAQKIDIGYSLSEVLPDLGETPEDIARIVASANGLDSVFGAQAVAAFRSGEAVSAAVGD